MLHALKLGRTMSGREACLHSQAAWVAKQVGIAPLGAQAA
jgi:hypothetical protein